MSAKRGDTIRRALEKGERDCRLLDGRDFDAAYWRNARRQLSVLLRDLEKAQGLNEAYRVSFTGTRSVGGDGDRDDLRPCVRVDQERGK